MSAGLKLSYRFECPDVVDLQLECCNGEDAKVGCRYFLVSNFPFPHYACLSNFLYRQKNRTTNFYSSI